MLTQLAQQLLQSFPEYPEHHTTNERHKITIPIRKEAHAYSQLTGNRVQMFKPQGSLNETIGMACYSQPQKVTNNQNVSKFWDGYFSKQQMFKVGGVLAHLRQHLAFASACPNL